MRILLDNNIPYRLKHQLADLAVTHVQDVGLDSLLDGQLLSAIDGRFDALVTMDRGMQFQQNLSGRRLALIVLRAKGSRLALLTPLMPGLRAQISSCMPGHAYEAGL